MLLCGLRSKCSNASHLLLLISALSAVSHPLARAQTVDDGVMISGRGFFGGYLYTRDSWDHYWEGTLFRANGNIGTLTTQTGTISVNYGVTGRLNLIATIPHVGTDASQGVLQGQHGWQDLSLAVKFRVHTWRFERLGALSVFGVPVWGMPLTDYTPDLQPLSIGLHSMRVGGRSTVNLQTNRGWFLNATGAYTWRGTVTLTGPTISLMTGSFNELSRYAAGGRLQH
jgi:hypothetical protein